MTTRTDAGGLAAIWASRVEYGAAWSLQQRLFLERLEGAIPDVLLLLEHPPTYTLGRRSGPDDLVYGESELKTRGIAVFEVDRGGKATYHGPGQLVGYPIVRLGDRYDVVAYLRRLEEALIATVGELGVEAHRDREHTGVWVGRNKIGAIGVKVTRGITMHGFALNVTTDLSMFEGIVPCGLRDRWVTSVAQETGRNHALADVAGIAAERVASTLGRALTWTHPDLLVRPESLQPEAATRT